MSEENEPKQPVPEREKHVFMVIEDNAFVNSMLCQILEKYGDTVGIYNGFEVLQIYSETRPDAVFLDIHLPDISGLDLIDKIRDHDPDSYIIMITGDATEDNIHKAKEKGADGFLAKPITKDTLTTTIKKFKCDIQIRNIKSLSKN